MQKYIIFFFLTITLCRAGPAKIVRPCRLSDYRCIGANLAANSNCNRNVQGYLPGAYRVDKFRFETPNFNTSYIDWNLIARGFNKCFVSEFFFNLDSQKAVISVDCPNFDVEADRELIRHHSLTENTYEYYNIRSIYSLIRVTVNLPATTHMNLCRSNVFADVIGRTNHQITPRDKAYLLPRDPAQLAIFEKENWYFRGFPVARTFIDNYICDYNCPPHILD